MWGFKDLQIPLLFGSYWHHLEFLKLFLNYSPPTATAKKNINIWHSNKLKSNAANYSAELYDPDLIFVCVCLSCWSYPHYILLPTWILPCWEFPLSFLTKPSEQPAKNNITCCLSFGLRPLAKPLLGEELIWLKTSLTLASMAASNSKHRPDFQLQAQTAQEDRETKGGVEGESLYFWTSSLSIYSGPRLDRGHFKLFSDTKHAPTQSLGGFILQRACLALLGWAQNCFYSFHSPCCEWAKIETERGDVLKGGTEEGLG